METPKDQIIKYYSQKESRLGYKYFMWDSKHLGYYPRKITDIPERQAQIEYQNLIGQTLKLHPGEKILDAGCGRGVVACHLATNFGVQVTGLDIIPFEIETARKKAHRLGIESQTNFQVADYSVSQLPGESFDALYANETLSHAPDLHRTFQEFFRLLQPGGRLVLFEYVLADEAKFSPKQRSMVDFIMHQSAMVGLKQFRTNTILPMLRTVGFENLQQTDITEFVKPSFRRLYKLAGPFYPIIKLFKLQSRMINATSAAELYPMVEQGLIYFYIYTANKAT